MDLPIFITDDIEMRHQSPHRHYYQIFPGSHAGQGQNFIQNFLASIRVTHLDIRTHGSALRPHFNVFVTGSEVSDDEVWLYLYDHDHLTSRVYATKQGQGTTLQLPFTTTCHGADHLRCRNPAIPWWNGRNLSHQLKPTRLGGSTHGFRARRRRY
jgi:hypothetical protein